MNNLKKYRKLRKLTQMELANKAGFKWQTFISQCETGEKRLPFDLALKLADILDCDVYDLMGDDIYKKSVTDQISKLNEFEQWKLKNGSFIDSFSSLVDDFVFAGTENYLLTEKDNIFFNCCQLLKNGVKVANKEDLTNLKILIEKWIDFNNKKYGPRDAYLDFFEDLDKFDDQNKKEGGKPNEKNN